MKKTLFKTLFLLLALANFGQAHAGGLADECGSALEGNSDFLKAGFRPTDLRYGTRGFLGVQPKVSIENLDIAGKYGVIRWEQRVFIVNSIEEAIAHSQAGKDSQDRGLYFIFDSKEEDEGASEEANGSRAGEVPEVLGKQLVVVQDGELSAELSAEETWELLDRESLGYHKAEKGPSFYSLEGWVLPHERNIITGQSVDEGVKTYGAIKKFTAKALNSGYQIVFNNRPESASNLSRKHLDEYVSADSNSVAVGSDVANFKELFDQSHAFTAEVYAPQTDVGTEYGEGGMIAGVTGHIQGKLYVVDSVFYPPIDGGKKYAESALLALITRLFDAGIDFIDTTKVSQFATKHMRAFRVKTKELQHRILEIPEDAEVDINTAFTCKEVDCESINY